MDARRGRVPLPDAPNRGQPRTLKEALQALAESRRYAAMLEGTAKAQKAEEQKLMEERAELRDELAKSRAALCIVQDRLDDENREHESQLISAQKELTKTLQRLAEVEQSEQSATSRLKEWEAQAARLSMRLDAARAQSATWESAFERVNADLTEMRNRREQYAKEDRALKNEVIALTAARDQLTWQVSELSRNTTDLREKLEMAQQSLSKRDAEAEYQERIFTVAKQSHEEAQAIAESLKKSLATERTARIAAEQLSQDLVASFWTGLQPAPTREDLLTAQLREARLHRDTAVAESDALATRLLDLISPQRYQEHAEAAGYNPKEDPLYLLKRREVVVEDQYAQWQAEHGMRVRARRFDPEQTLVDQAYAATLSAKWKLKDHPHVRLKNRPPRWRIIGIWLDAESERYLLEITQARIGEIERKIGMGLVENG